MINSKNYLVRIFAGLILLISCTSLFADPPLPTPVGRVVWVKGNFKAVMPNKEERSLQKLSLIYLHDTLLTDDKTQAQIVFTDNTLMTFREGTKFIIENYSFDNDKKKGSAGKFIMNLLEGGFRTITGLIEKKNPEDYAINTPVATIGARGTEYVVALKNGELSIGFYDGEPCVTNKGKKVCLSKTSPYAVVPSGARPPELASSMPAALKVNLEISPAKLEQFVAPEGVRGGKAGPSGTVSSFCISS